MRDCTKAFWGNLQWFLALLQVTCAYSSIPKECIQSSLSSDLTAAVSSAFPLCLSLFPSTAHSYLLTSASVSAEVTVYAEASEIDLAGLVTISSSGNLTIYNASLEAGIGKFEVRGRLELLSCTVKGWQHAFLQGTSGFIVVKGSFFEGNEKLFELQSAISAIFTNSVFVNNTGLILSLQACEYALISHCLFRKNRSLTLLHLSPFPGQRAEVSNCGFEGNSGTLVSVRSGNVSLGASVGTGNTGSGLHIDAVNTEIAVWDVQWSGNKAPFLLISRLEGTVSVGNSSFAHQSDIGAVQIVNSGSSALCQVTLWAINFTDSWIYPVFPTASVIYSLSCSVSLVQSSIQNCTTQSTVMSEAYGAIAQLLGVLVLREVTLEASGSSGSAVLMILATGEIEALRLVQAVVGGGTMIALQSASLRLRNVEVVGMQRPRIRAYSGSAVLVLTATSSSLVCQNATISDFSVEQGGNFLLMSSLMTCNFLSMRNVTVYTAIAEFGSQGTANSLVFEQVQFVHLMEIVGGSIITSEGIALYDSTLSDGLVCSSSGGLIHLDYLTIYRSNVGFLVFAYKTRVFLQYLRVADSAVAQLMRNLLDCDLQLRGLDYRNTTGGLITARSSLIAIAEAYLDGLRSDSVMALYACNVSISAVQVASVHSTSMAISGSYSHISLHQIAISYVDTPQDSFITLTLSSLLLNSTRIEHFNTQLISAHQCNITILSSFIADGKVARQESGGAVSCVSCWEVSVLDSVFEDMRAEQGGGVYVEGTEVEGRLGIVNSWFKRCTASNGGAGVVRNMALQVVNSHFEDCVAAFSGGALDIRTKVHQFRLISNSNFINNTAHEGGALKWRSFPTTIQNCTFELNTAVYGANLASYGASLSLIAADFYPPGQPVHLTYELLDHYGQRLILENRQAINLVGTNITFKGVTNRVTEGGVANFTALEIYAKPAQTVTIQAMCKGKYEGFDLAFQMETKLHMRDCQIGEIRRNNSCEICAEGYFSLSPADPSCTLCPNIALCPGGSLVFPKSGAWLNPQSPQLVLSCPIPVTCEGGELNACASGYAGKLCAQCAQDYFEFLPVTCWSCPHLALSIAETLFVVLLYLLWLQLLFRCPDSKMHLVRVFIQHIQVLAALAYTRQEMPTDLQIFLRGALSLATLSAVTFPQQCLAQGSYMRLGVAVGALSLALFLGILLLICRNCYYRDSSRRSKERVRLCMGFCWYLPLAGTLSLLSLFSCQPMPGMGEWLVSDMQQSCWNKSNLDSQFFLSLFSLLIVVVTPMTAEVIQHRTEKLQGGYHAICQLFRLLTIGAVILQMGLSPSSQLTLSLCFLYFLLAFNALAVSIPQLHCILMPVISYFLLTLSFSLQFATTHTQSRSGHQAVSAIIISANCIFLLLLLIAILRPQASISDQVSVSLNVSSASPSLLVPPNQSLADPDMVDLAIPS